MAVLTPITSPFMFSSGPPELPGLMAASVWIKCWNWPGAPWSMVRFLAEMMPAVTVCARANGLPMASTQSPTCGSSSELPIFTVGSGVLVSILITARSVALSTPITRAGRPRSCVIGIGRELDVNLVGLVDHVIVGDDVAFGIDNEARTQRLLHLAVVALIGPAGNLAAEEAVEEVLEVVLALC